MQPLLKTELQNLIKYDGADVFYVGDQGRFDSMVRKTLEQLKQDYPHIRYAVVSACMSAKCRKQDCLNDTDTLFLRELVNTRCRYAIYKRNLLLLIQ